MPEIDASNGLTIQHEPGRWSLNNGRDERKIAIVTANSAGLAYQPAFATARRLPASGQLPASQLSMVVVGWAVEDSSWHLGVLLDSRAAESRGGRWCGLARWEDQDGDLAERAGQALAEVLAKPFRVVPPPGQQPTIPTVPVREPDAEPQPVLRAPAHALEVAPPLPIKVTPPPIDLSDWTLEEDPVGLALKRSKTWNQGLLVRGLFFAVLTPVFGFLSIGALLSLYAPVQPEWLPFVGLAITVIMLFGALFQFATLLRGPLVVIDRRSRLLRKMTRSGRRVLVQSPFEGLQYVLVSHVINRRRARKPTVDGESGRAANEFWAEVWIHAFSPRRGFIELCHVTDIEGRMRPGSTFEEKRPLDLNEINSPVHHAAILIAQMMELPIFVEER